MLTPIELLTMHPNLILTIDSTEDTRKTECRQNFAKYADLNPGTIAMRYEPDTDYLFVDAGWLSPEDAADLFKNTQYKGKTSIRLLKGTGHTTPACTAHVFDLKATSALRATHDKGRRDNYRRQLMRDLKGNIPAVAAKMAEFDARDEKLKHIDDSAERIRVLEALVKSLSNDILRMIEGKNPLTIKRRQKTKPIGRLDALTTFIRNNKPSFSADITKLEITNRIPEHIHTLYLTPHKPIGILKESINLDGTHHRRRLHIEAAAIKHIIPNYRRDIRYTTSHTTYIKHLDADGNPTTTNLYCAVFDLLK